MWDAFLNTLPKEAGKYAAGVVLTVVLFVVFRVLLLINRRRLLRFFGLSTRCPDLAIYLSRMDVVSTKGLEPFNLGYQGLAVLNPELIGALKVRDLIKTSRVAVLSRSIREQLGRHFIAIAPVDPTIQVSPEIAHLDGLPAGNVICLGNQLYNSVFWRHNKVSECVEFGKNEKGMRAIRFKYGGWKDITPLTREIGPNAGVFTREIGTVERVNDEQNGRTFFYCAGLGASSTQGCVQYLVQHWETLFADNGTDEFAFYLVFPNQPTHAEVSVEPEKPMYIKQGKRPPWWMHLF